MANPNDVTIDIPMTEVTSRGRTGARKATLSPTAYNSSSKTLHPTNDISSHHPLHRGPGGRRRKMEQRGKENEVGEDGTLTAAGKIYDKIFHASVLTRYAIYLVPVGFMIAVPIVVGSTVAQNATIGGVRILWLFTWVEVVWLSLWASKLVAQFLPYLFQFLCGVVSSGTRKYALVITALEIPLSLVGWATAALTTFVPLMTLNPTQRDRGETSLKPWESIVKNILFATLISSIIFLAEKLLIQLISISYHRKQFDDKIQQSKRNVYLISLLYNASRSLFPAYCSEFAEEDYLIHDILKLGGSRGDSKHARSGSITPMRFIQNVGRIGDKVTAAFGNVAQEITGKQVFNPTESHSVVVEAFERKASSEALARRLWMSFVMEGNEALYLEDIHDVLGAEHEDVAEECFDALDVDGNGDISLEEMILRVGQFAKERYWITNSMHDVDQAISVLDSLLCTVVVLVVAFVFVAFLNKSLTTTLATAGTALLSLSFVFAATAQELLGSCLFLFVKHAFDVGDRVDIGDVQLKVERISLLYTVFRRVKDHKKTQVANIVLNTLWIDNISRSKAMREQVLMYINFDTTLEDIELLKKEMQKFVSDKDNSRDFQSDIDIEVTGIAEMNKLELKVEIRHKSNWSNEAVRAARRSKFMCALVLALRKVPIYGPGAGGAAAGECANPTYTVSISDEQAATNKKDFADTKEKKRLVPANTRLTPASKDSPAVGRSSSIDYLGNPSIGTATKDAALLDNMKPIMASLEQSNEDSGRDEQLKKVETDRANNIEEVRGLLRHQSSAGKRKPHQNNALAEYQFPSSSVPAIVETPPASATPSTSPPPPITRLAPRVSYYEENGYKSTPPASQMTPRQRAGTLGSEATSGPMSASAFDAYSQHYPQQYQQPYPPQPQMQQQRSGTTTQSPHRRPVPGMQEMKGHLGQHQSGSRNGSQSPPASGSGPREINL